MTFKTNITAKSWALVLRVLYARVLKITLASVLRLYGCQNFRIQDFIDAQIKENIDDAKIANLQEQFRKQCTILFSCVKSTC